MTKRLDSKAALVTGGATGIGGQPVACLTCALRHR
jgi:NAD(P)-dependent dehydrogenase (short-subunit alcohol dehydrogenase family)